MFAPCTEIPSSSKSPVIRRFIGNGRFLLASLAALLLFGCATLYAPAPTVPLQYLSYQTDNTQRHRNLLVLLRGYGDDNTVFAREGIVDEVRSRHLPFDVIAPNAHFGYYRSHTIEIRLKEDIIEPARRQGYKHIWLAGVSMGGLGCILYLRKYPHDVDGVLLTSPFLGRPPIFHEISGAGGVAAWQQTSDDTGDWERMIWSWIKYHDFTAAPPIWMGYGDRDDIVSDGPMLLASRLPAKRVFTVHGEHDIPTFKEIFIRHLDMLARRSSVVTASPSIRGTQMEGVPRSSGVATAVPLARATEP